MELNGEQLLLRAAALWGLVLATFALGRPPRTAATWSFAGGMLLLALDCLLLAGGAWLIDAPWAQLVVTAALPAPWLAFSVCFARGNARDFLRAWKFTLLGSAFLPIAAVLAWHLSGHFAEPSSIFETINARLATQRDWLGRAVHLATLVAAVLVLMNLERTFRASVGTLRWRIKFVIIGLGLIFAARFYSSSQGLLYAASVRDGAPVSGLSVINAGALLLGCILITVSFFRAPLAGVEVYPTRSALEASLTVVLAGAYLVVVGVFAKVVAFLGGDAAFPLKALVVLLLVVIVGLVLASDRARLYWRRFLSRHLHRPFYDYRGLWRNFTERTRTIVDESAYARELAALISDAAQTLSVSIWIERMGKLTLAASTSLATETAASRSANPDSVDLPMPYPALSAPKDGEPFILEDSREPWVEELKQQNPDQFQKGGKRICVPLLAGEISVAAAQPHTSPQSKELLGLLIIGDRVNGVAFSIEDFELFKSLATHAASGLLNLRLTRQLVQARELEAFQTMSAFLVHDLKNTASTLSLMLGNLPTHFDDPQFRADALQAVSKSVGRINDLISRLTVLRQKPELQRTDTDLNETVKATLAEFKGQDIACELNPLPKVAIDAEQIGKVLTNLVLNAREASGPSGRIRVATRQRDRWAVLSVEDDGCGMSREFISRSLFRPFQTTKKKGIGIGMYHSKVIVDAHGGRIEVESELNKGATFRVLLPVKE